MQWLNSLRSRVHALKRRISRSSARAIGDLDQRQALDQVEPRAGGVQRREHDRRRGLVAAEQEHQQIDEHAFVVGPAEHQVADQRQQHRLPVGMVVGGDFDRGEIGGRRKPGAGHAHLAALAGGGRPAGRHPSSAAVAAASACARGRPQIPSLASQKSA
jgi:hypothetical protein